MSYKTILSYLPTPERAEALLDVVLPMVKAQDAHHVGLHVMPRVYTMYAGVEAQIPLEIIEKQEQGLKDRAAKVEAVHDRKARGAGTSHEWRCFEARYADLSEDIIERSMCADLIVIGLDGMDLERGWTDFPARIAMQTGRPVLTVPNAATVESLGRKVLIAWNRSREATRAAFEALPLLADADTVRILTVDSGGASDADDGSQITELVDCLARHGVRAPAIAAHAKETTVTQHILHHVGDEGCDLLVMGCYGHSRLRETLFGGVTKEILQHLSVPVLMAH